MHQWHQVTRSHATARHASVAWGQEIPCKAGRACRTSKADCTPAWGGPVSMGESGYAWLLLLGPCSPSQPCPAPVSCMGGVGLLFLVFERWLALDQLPVHNPAMPRRSGCLLMGAVSCLLVRVLPAVASLTLPVQPSRAAASKYPGSSVLSLTCLLAPPCLIGRVHEVGESGASVRPLLARSCLSRASRSQLSQTPAVFEKPSGLTSEETRTGCAVSVLPCDAMQSISWQ